MCIMSSIWVRCRRRRICLRYLLSNKIISYNRQILDREMGQLYCRLIRIYLRMLIIFRTLKGCFHQIFNAQLAVNKKVSVYLKKKVTYSKFSAMFQYLKTVAFASTIISIQLNAFHKKTSQPHHSQLLLLNLHHLNFLLCSAPTLNFNY